MQNSVIHIIDKLEGADQLDAVLSFRGFVHFLKKRRQQETSMKVKFFDFMIRHFEERLGDKEYLALEEMSQYHDLLELMYTSIFPALVDEKDSLWALGVPVTPIIFYGTDAFYNVLRDPVSKEIKVLMIDREERERKGPNLEVIYSLILEKLYGYASFSGNSIIRSLQNETTGLSGFFRLNIDSRFIEVFSKGPLPDIDLKLFHSGMTEDEILARLQEHLPLSGFRFEGIAAITVTDITEEHVRESIKSIILNPAYCENDACENEVTRYLGILSGSGEVNFGLLPLLKINDRPVFSDESWDRSVMAHADGNLEDLYLEMAGGYFRDPTLILYEQLPERKRGEPAFLESLRRTGIQSFGVMPVYYNSRITGALEVSSRREGVVNAALLARLDRVIPLLAQILRLGIEEFDERIQSIIKENFTSLQPSVEWRFNEAAWHFERQRQLGNTTPTVEPIYFKEIYPLYGEIDIRNSTVERNAALRRDLQMQFGILNETLASLRQIVSLHLLEELTDQSEKWQKTLAGVLTTVDEINLNTFLKEKVAVFLEHFGDSRPDVAAILEPYLAAIDEGQGIAFQSRRQLEQSIQLINKTISRHLEEATTEIQEVYPSYFEKFRTDGIEYDIYIGQSIAPDRPFDLLYLQNLRLWQLHSMVIVARLTRGLLPRLPESLQTTQLIFVHSAPIDISFRKDERRFDVEGGYNIRYQVVKKRIDKVHVRDTGERLTQPGKIAIIYFNEKEAEEYTGYFRYLQEKGWLKQEIEFLELEELQGVSGLKALRVGVDFSEGAPTNG
jgi:hypothetical protein